VFELPGGWGVEPPTVFSAPLTDGQIMYRGGVNYMLYAYYIHHNFGRSLTVEKFNPLANFSQ